MKPVTIFIPVYNEEDIIAENTQKLISFLDNLATTYQIIIGSNGSTDRTKQLGEELQHRYKSITFFHINRIGVGTAFKKGIGLSSYEHIISIDIDLSFDLDFMKHAIELLDSFDIIIGSKKMGRQKRSFIRRAGSYTFIVFARTLLGLSFEDYSIGAKAYKRHVVENYLNKVNHGTSYVLDVIYHAHKDGYRIKEIPVGCNDMRKSKFNLLHEGIYRFKNLFRLWLVG